MKAARMLHLALCQLKQCQLMTRTTTCSVPGQLCSQFNRHMSKAAEDVSKELNDNPFLDKYLSKIQSLKETSPEEYNAKLEELNKAKTKYRSEDEGDVKQNKPKAATTTKSVDVSSQPTPVKPKSLDDVLKLDMIKDKSRNEIEQIWKQYHSRRSGLFAVLEADEYQSMFQKAQQCTLFVYPLPKPTGYEFILSQWSGHECNFTPLISYQKHQENSPTCMSLIHYPELIDDKGIVLMAGEFDSEVLKAQEATILAQQVQFYYGLSRHRERFELVRLFNNLPRDFNYMALISHFEKLGLGFAS